MVWPKGSRGKIASTRNSRRMRPEKNAQPPTMPTPRRPAIQSIACRSGLPPSSAETAIDAAAIVPGHGPVQRDWSYAKKVAALLAEIERQVGDQVRKGATLEQTQEAVDLSAFRKSFAGDRFDRGAAFGDFFVRSAVDRAYQETKGAMAEE